MVKRASELPLFEELFGLYFSGLGEIIKEAGQAVQDALSMSDQEFQKFLEEIEEMLKKKGQQLSELARRLLQNNSGQLEKMIAEAARQIRVGNIERSVEENYFARALSRQLGIEQLERQLGELKEELRKSGQGGAFKARMEEYIDRRLKALNDIIKRYVRVEREKRDLPNRDNERTQQLAEKSFYYLSDDEIRKMNEAVTRLAQRLKNVISVRRRRAKRGRFDSKKTLQAQSRVRRSAVSAALRSAQEGQTAGRGALRRFGFGPQRFTLHAAVRLRAAGPLFAGPQLYLCGRDRRGHRTLPRQ